MFRPGLRAADPRNRVRIIDKGDGVAGQSRALGIHARTLEVFDMMGLAGRFVARGQVVRRFHMYTDGKTLVSLELGLDAWRDQIEVAEAADGLRPAGNIYLARPDGYVAARGSVTSPGGLLDYLRQLFGDADRGDQALAAADTK